MASPDITVANALLANEIITDVDAIPAAIQARADVLFPSVVSWVEHQAVGGVAPSNVLNLCVVRLLGYMWDSDPSEARANKNGWIESGAAQLHAPYANRGSTIIGKSGQQAMGRAMPNGGAFVPLPPENAEDYILTINAGGQLEWVPLKDILPQP